ncbi:ribose-5-phosphate isomerase RpiA [Bacillus mangrovi]|uniref:Ribose-5-phosphate isomerase A n=1 Tax=Metabacillus mangrovi TaxID=1491830 RepID=A0A7X2S159_9BACI|nr:ribose-5-phosphate isomerase RpiA [Metabacillus mangrovi]MTH51954.1 ribose-5-phosphate isomerase RpiA [Metabacillus mangrovi]
MIEKKQAGEYAVRYIKEGMTIGLGTGSTVAYTIEKIGALVQQGLSIKGVATSVETEKKAAEFGIPLISFNEAEKIDLTIDGADEIDPQFNGIKGGGGALFREKLVALASDQVLWVADHAKLVQRIGNVPLPVEAASFGWMHTGKLLQDLNLKPVLRKTGEGHPYYTDNGNVIFDLNTGPVENPEAMAAEIIQIPGVIEHGLFLRHPDTVITGVNGSVVIRDRQS